MARPVRSHALGGGPIAEDYPPLRPGSDVAALRLATIPIAEAWSVQGDPADLAFLAAAREALGGALPDTVGRMTGVEGGSALGIGPGAYLVVRWGQAARAPPRATAAQSPDADAEASLRLATVRATIGAAGGAVFALGHAWIALRVSGPAAPTVLAKGTAIDLDPTAFGPGQCRSTLIAKMHVVIVHQDDTPAYLLLVDRSYAQSFRSWLTEACREYGEPIGPGEV